MDYHLLPRKYPAISAKHVIRMSQTAPDQTTNRSDSHKDAKQPRALRRHLCRSTPPPKRWPLITNQPPLNI